MTLVFVMTVRDIGINKKTAANTPIGIGCLTGI